MQPPSTEPGQRNSKQILIVAGAVLAILGSALCLYQTEFRATDLNLPLHRAVGEIMAEETSRLIGHMGKVVVVSVSVPQAPELKVQVEAFERHLKLLGGISIKSKVMLDPGDNPKYRAGAGLSAKHLLKIARKNAGADAIVSFVGAPELSEVDLAQLKATPRLIAETRSPERLVNLFKRKVLQAAIVPRFEFPAPGPRKPETGRQWFDRYFQILAADSPLPVEDASP
jgi:hypothetical protein